MGLFELICFYRDSENSGKGNQQEIYVSVYKKLFNLWFISFNSKPHYIPSRSSGNYELSI